MDSPAEVVELMLESRESWVKISTYIKGVKSDRERAVRLAQRGLEVLISLVKVFNYLVMLFIW